MVLLRNYRKQSTPATARQFITETGSGDRVDKTSLIRRIRIRHFKIILTNINKIITKKTFLIL